MKNDKSQFVVRTSDFYLSLVICHLPFDPRLVAKDFSSRNLRALGALRGFAVNPGLDFHREGAKHAKKTRRTLVWLRPCCSVFICVSFTLLGPESENTRFTIFIFFLDLVRRVAVDLPSEVEPNGSTSRRIIAEEFRLCSSGLVE